LSGVPAQPRQDRRAALIWLFFSLRGRVSRGLYWLGYFFLIALNSVLVGQLIGGPEQASFFRLAEIVTPVMVILTLYCNVALSVKRLHDIGYVGLFALALLIPLVNLAFTIWVGLLPGSPGANRFGALIDQPPQRET
jgi:uncharacterized membrane protein YhaH (DUF805 family)